LAELLSVDDAQERILAQIVPLSAEDVALDEALGRIVAEDVRARIALPPFANSSMDGFALIAADTQGATREAPAQLRVVMDVPAGSMPPNALRAGEAARIMTGAPLPEGADAVVPVELTDQTWSGGDDGPLPETVRIFAPGQPGAYVRAIGDDIPAGHSIVPAGTELRAAELGVLAALGHTNVRVMRQPRVAIVSTGSEVVDLGQPLRPGAIYNSNSYLLTGLVSAAGGVPLRIATARDTLDEVRARFNEALAFQPDVVISSAGVSVGAFDVVRTVLAELGEVGFWRVNLRPGKPLAYGKLGGVPFFGLPGNPVSAAVTFDLFVRPTLLKLGGRPDRTVSIEAHIDEPIKSDGRRSYLRVTLTREHDRWIARTTGTQNSSALLSMVLADGLLIIPEGVTDVPAGATLPVRLLRPLEELK
jgi:molybdopterin molybdotransferase